MADDVVIHYLEERSKKRLDALISALHRSLHAVAHRIVDDAALADDVTQEVYSKLATSAWDPAEVVSGRALLHSLTVRTAKNMKRGWDRRVERETEFVRRRDGELDRSPSFEERYETLLEALKGLDGDMRRCIELRYLDGLKNREIARRMRCHERSVERLLSSGRRRLRSRLSASQRALVLPLFDYGLLPCDPQVSEEHLASLRDTLEEQAREHFEMVSDATASTNAAERTSQDLPPEDPSPARRFAESRSRERRRPTRRSFGSRRVRSIAFYAACVLVVGGGGTIAWWLGTQDGVLGSRDDATGPLAAVVQDDPDSAVRNDAPPTQRGGPGEDPPDAPRAPGAGVPVATANLPAAQQQGARASTSNLAPAGLRMVAQGAIPGMPDMDNPLRYPPAEIRRDILFGDEWGPPLWGIRLYGAAEKPDDPTLAPYRREATLKVGENPRRFAVPTSREWREMATGTRARVFPRRTDEGALQRDGRLALSLPNSAESVIEVRDAKTDQPVPVKFVASARVESGTDAPLVSVGGSDGNGTLHGLSSDAYTDIEINETRYCPVSIGDLDLLATKTVWLQPVPSAACAAGFMLWDGPREYLGARMVVIHRDVIGVKLTGDAYYSCAFDGLVPGDYRFEVHVGDRPPQGPAGAAWWGARLKPGSASSFSMDLGNRLLIGWAHEPKFTFRILDSAGRPVPDVDVLLDRGWQRLEGGSEAGGTFNIPAGGYFSITLEGETRWMLHSYLGLTPAEQKKPPVYEFTYGSRTVRGRITGVRGEAPQHVLLVTKTRSSYVDVEADGRFQFTGVVEGNHLLLVFEEPGVWLPLYRTVTVKPEADPAPIEFRLDELAPVWAVLPAPSHSTDIKEKVVAIAADESECELRARHRGTRGREFFGLLPAGEHRIEVRRGAAVYASGDVEVRRGDEATVELKVVAEPGETAEPDESSSTREQPGLPTPRGVEGIGR